ncbi:hypothetical protein BG842_03265 [Haladaptatus sp. W1]|uniref:glycosyltransferase family 4 protein n=1 Tax=Haladaptatus sp. W1 TaxID=1897478 RepID=UPI00084977A6|nr:glycosyltransferase family 4 protein [Haladaptatus sp. W1]ODR79828.1 hypothetical protein BG842_03265 [Haladaptatus sp. W1]
MTQSKINVLLIGPVNPTGGIAQYINELVPRLPEPFDPEVHGVDSLQDHDGFSSFLVGLIDSTISFVFRSEPDVAHIHTSHGASFFISSVYILFAAKVWDSKTLIHVHGSSFDDFVTESSFPVKKYVEFVLRVGDGTIVLSDYWKDVLTSVQLEKDIYVLQNAVDPSEYNSTEENGNTVKIAYISNLIDRKGSVESSIAFKQLCEEEVDCQIEIAGKGINSDRMELLDEQFNQVTYHGYVSETKKREILENSDIYVLPSYAEGLPIAILEAMAGENAIVSTNVGSIPEVVSDKNGRLIKPRSTEEILEALKTLVKRSDEVEKMGTESRRMIEDKYNWDVVIEQLAQIYRNK